MVAPAYGVLNKEKKREVPFDKYGPPPKPAPIYGVPHRTYGVPQHVPFKEYGPPPTKLQFKPIYGGGFKHNHIQEQVVKHFSIPKPVYGPPHGKPAQIYGPPKPFPIYGPQKPAKVYGPPPRPQLTYG